MGDVLKISLGPPFPLFQKIGILGDLAPECFWAFQTRATFGGFLKKFPLSPLCTFSENAGFG